MTDPSYIHPHVEAACTVVDVLELSELGLLGILVAIVALVWMLVTRIADAFCGADLQVCAGPPSPARPKAGMPEATR